MRIHSKILKKVLDKTRICARKFIDELRGERNHEREKTKIICVCEKFRKEEKSIQLLKSPLYYPAKRFVIF